MSRCLTLLVGSVLLLGASATAASAASLTISANDAPRGYGFNVRYSGVADSASRVSVYAAKDDAPCASNEQNFSAAHSTIFGGVGPVSVPAGSFSGAVYVNNSNNDTPPEGQYRLCAYLTTDQDPNAEQPAATATDTVKYLAPIVRTVTKNGFSIENGVAILGGMKVQTLYGRSIREDGKFLPIKATVEVSVSSATRSKYHLPSAVIMRGISGSPDNLSQQFFYVKSTAAVAKKLKGAKTLSGVTIKVNYTQGVTETVTEKVTLSRFSSGGSRSKVRPAYVVLRSSTDTAAVKKDNPRG